MTDNNETPAPTANLRPISLRPVEPEEPAKQDSFAIEGGDEAVPVEGTDTQIAIWRAEGYEAAKRAANRGELLGGGACPYDGDGSEPLPTSPRGAWINGVKQYEEEARINKRSQQFDGDEDEIIVGTDGKARSSDTNPTQEVSEILGDAAAGVGKMRDAVAALVRRMSLLRSELDRHKNDLQMVLDLARAKGYDMAGVLESAEATAQFMVSHQQSEGRPNPDGTWTIGPRTLDEAPVRDKGGL